MAGFSSRGPVPGEWAIKPDILAPGVSIVSTVPTEGILGDPSGYLSLSGTSMSAPHIAGSAALIKQLHPTWTPEMIKANLMNTSLDVNYDVFTQGAGRVQLPQAAQAGATVAPGSLSLGLDDLTLDLWQVNKTMMITNVSDTTKTYAIGVEHSLPLGVVVTADPASVTLAPGEVRQVQFALSVDNTIVPNAPDVPFSYEGMVVFSGDDALRVPFAFLKAPIINFTFDENPWIVWVHNRTGDSQFKFFPGTSLQLPVAGGTYDVVVAYGDVATRVFKEDFLVETLTNVAVSKSDAIHDVAIAPLDIDGNPLSADFGGERVEHKDSGSNLGIIFGFPTQRRFSDISNAYSWEWVLTRSVSAREPVYDFNGFANDGVTGDLTFQNQPSDLKHMTFHYNVAPGVENLLFWHWRSDGPWGGSSFAGCFCNEAESLKAPFVRDQYFMPIPYPGFAYGYMFEELFPFDSDTGEVLWNSTFAWTSYLAAQDATTVEGFLLGEPDVPVFRTDSTQMRVALPPPHWSGSFSNTDSEIQIRAARGRVVWPFLNQMQGMTPQPTLPYELYTQSGDLVETGDLQLNGSPFGGPSSVSISVGSGAYTLKVFYDKYYVAGMGGLATLSASFDTQAGDKDPPTLLALNVLYSPEPTDTVPPTATGQVKVAFTEILPVLPIVEYSTSDGDNWNALAVTHLGSGDYSATLPILPNNTLVSLRVRAQDGVGNSIDYQMVPAFVVALETPALLSPPDGFATDKLDITFQWGAVQTAVEYRLQTDSGDAFTSPNLDIITTGTQHTATLSKGTHYWRVLARDSQSNESPWSVVWRLAIADLVVQVTTYTGGDFSPTIMEADDGELWVAWETCRSHCRIWYKTSDDGGATWSLGTKLTLQSFNDLSPTITQTSGGRIWVAWHSYRNTNPSGAWNTDIFYKTTDDDGVTWSATTLLTTDTADDYAPDITQTVDGKVWVVWYSYRSGDADLWYKTSDDNGVTWSDAIRLTTHSGDDIAPAITQMADGKVWVVWNRWSELWYTTSSDGGLSWSPESMLAGCCNYGASITQTTDGRIWVAWYSHRNTNPAGVWNWDIFYRYSNDNGATWSPDIPFTRFLGHDFIPDITSLSGGSPALVWHSNRSGNNDIWFGVIGSREDVRPPPYIQWSTHEPWPNPDAEDVVTITAMVVDETGVAGVELVWSVDGASKSDRQMFDDGAHGDELAGDGIYGFQIGPFAVGTQVEYQVRATNIDGNTFLGPEFPQSFVSLAPFVATSNNLLALDTTWPGDVNFIAPFYKNALDDLGLAYDFWDGSLRGFVDLPTLNQYLDGVVIWAMPDWGHLLSWSDARDNLASFLDGGGKLFISGQRLGDLQWIDSSFFQNYLHSSSADSCVGVQDVQGKAGDLIGDGLGFRIQGGDGANNQWCPHVIVPRPPAEPVFRYVDLQGVTTLAPQPPQYDAFAPSSSERREGEAIEQSLSPSPDNHAFPPFSSEQQLHPDVEGGTARSDIGTLSHIRSGDAALRVDTGVYRLVYFAFGHEAISSADIREEVIGRVLNWLASGDVGAGGSIVGQADLQWRADNSGAEVSLVGTSITTVTNPDGSFTLSDVPEGLYEVEVTLPTYLTAMRSGVQVVAGQVTQLPPLYLHGGDLNLDEKIDLLDLTMLMRNFYLTASEW